MTPNDALDVLTKKLSHVTRDVRDEDVALDVLRRALTTSEPNPADLVEEVRRLRQAVETIARKLTEPKSWFGPM